ncbi:ATP synthase subunit d, mitochondrial [Aplysia californica]|uniref:ATP synthase subunit d, mitochondrial n=1 Tax=Aplysia californica TaxID=6500 RepID=A0ABM0JWS2_APLCA|nr:ATP synthase subunit d, mitochondrial [Aplysia californica]
MASGATKRVVSSAIDWTRFAAVCPKWQVEMLRATKAKHDTFVNKVHQLPENLPKIDFASYKSRLPDPTMADRFQKAYEALSIPYPVDKANLLQKVEAQNSEKEQEVKRFKTEIQAEIEESKSFLKKIDTLPKFEEMTEEMFCYYFPETWQDPAKPKFWPYVETEQPGAPGFKYAK